MALEQTLEELERRRLGFKDRRDKIDEELAARRQTLLAEEISQINDLIAKARVEGGTLGQIKRAYGTKDHRTITTIIENSKSAIEYWTDAFASGKYGSWFEIVDEGTAVVIDSVRFEIIPLAGDNIMLNTDEPRWNADFTVENHTVKEFDAETESDNERVAEIAQAYRAYGNS